MMKQYELKVISTTLYVIYVYHKSHSYGLHIFAFWFQLTMASWVHTQNETEQTSKLCIPGGICFVMGIRR